jgi:AcrR family transcriptional regulator
MDRSRQISRLDYILRLICKLIGALHRACAVMPTPASTIPLEVNDAMTADSDTSEFGDDTSTRRRLLAATTEVLARSGQTKLSLSEVAIQAGVSRPTLYRWFASKEELLEAFGLYEREMFDSGISKATAGLRGNEKLDAALQFIVSYQQSYSGVRLIDIEPEVVISQLALVIPVMRTRLERLLAGTNRRVKAATVIRVAVSHYIVRSDDGNQFLAQLRHAAGIKPPE